MDYQEHPEIEAAISNVLQTLGEDVNREGLLRTPYRYSKSMQYLMSGYTKDLKAEVGEGVFTAESDEMVIVRDIELYSMCEHHLLPFFGKVHVAYIPNGKIIGLSKIPRIVDVFARRLQVQERLTQQISAALMETLRPSGVAVVVEAMHLCMMMRGVEKQNSRTITSSMQGVFREDSKSRKEVMDILQGLGRT